MQTQYIDNFYDYLLDSIVTLKRNKICKRFEISYATIHRMCKFAFNTSFEENLESFEEGLKFKKIKYVHEKEMKRFIIYSYKKVTRRKNGNNIKR